MRPWRTPTAGGSPSEIGRTSSQSGVNSPLWSAVARNWAAPPTRTPWALSARRIANRIDAGNVSVQDTFLTFASFAAGLEPDSFNYSGIGRGRPGMLAFVRKQGVLINTGEPASLLSEGIKSVG